MSARKLIELAPEIARELESVGYAQDCWHPSFLNWAVEEMDRLRASITPETTPDQRFQIQNRVATIAGTAHSYGQWLYRAAC